MMACHTSLPSQYSTNVSIRSTVLDLTGGDNMTCVLCWGGLGTIVQHHSLLRYVV